jgi:hypothetical protein
MGKPIGKRQLGGIWRCGKHWSLQVLQRTFCTFRVFLHPCYVPHPSHRLHLNHDNDIWRTVRIVNLHRLSLLCTSLFIHSHFLLLPLEHSASVKRFASLQFLNPIDIQYDSLDGGSARRKAATHTGQHKHRMNADIHASSGIRIHDPRIWAGEDR